MSVQDRYMVCTRRTIGSTGSSFRPFGHGANLDARKVHGLRQTYHWIGNHYERTRWNSWVTWVMWNLTSFHLEIMLVLVQDRCMVCARCTIGLQIILDAPVGLLGDVGHVESHFFPFGDSVNVGAR